MKYTIAIALFIAPFYMVLSSMPVMAANGDAAQGLVWLAIIIAAYFAPYIVAKTRCHHNSMAIGVCNLFSGWTFVGWVAALVWSCTQVKTK